MKYIAVVSTLLVVSACGQMDERVSMSRLEMSITNNDLDALSDEVLKLPYWLETTSLQRNQFSKYDVNDYKLVGSALSSLSLKDIEEVKRLSIKKAYLSSDEEGAAIKFNFFVLWRIIFDIPEETPYEEVISFQPMHVGLGSRATRIDGNGNKFFNERWPVVFDSQGNILEIERFNNMSGPMYRPQKDFEAISSKYPLRSL
ncbi:hypothetical protein KKB55_09150 [Myxococcota bacterium]|nr:hypothetical protein [Myxococcota bacterium]MBU1897901.1 hypothetical protein [Myxococcota bacterium]